MPGRKKKEEQTFHVPFTLVDNERVTSTPAFFVANYSDPFNGSITLEFTPEVRFCGTLVLYNKKVRKRVGRDGKRTYQSRNKKGFVWIANGLCVVRWFVCKGGESRIVRVGGVTDNSPWLF